MQVKVPYACFFSNIYSKIIDPNNQNIHVCVHKYNWLKCVVQILIEINANYFVIKTI